MVPSDKIIVRSTNAGCFIGTPTSTDLPNGIVVLTGTRRLWYWDGAATLSELATKGTSKPTNCKFPAPTEGEHTILGVCEIIPVTAVAKESIDKVKPWTMH